MQFSIYPMAPLDPQALPTARDAHGQLKTFQETHWWHINMLEQTGGSKGSYIIYASCIIQYIYIYIIIHMCIYTTI